MLPKRKYIRSYIGMGVAIPIYGQVQAVKLKIIGMLVSYDSQGASIEGLRLENIVLYKDVLVYDCTFERNGMTYVDPKMVFGSRREAVDYVDDLVVSKDKSKIAHYENEMKRLKSQSDAIKAEIDEYRKRLDKAITTKQKRKWNKSF